MQKGAINKMQREKKKSCQSHKSPTYFLPLCSLQPSKKTLPRIEILKEQRRAPFSVVERFIFIFIFFSSRQRCRFPRITVKKPLIRFFIFFLIYALIPLFNPISFFPLHSLTLVIKKACSLFPKKKNQLNSAGGIKAIRKAESKLR